MTLTAHGLVGAAIVSLMPAHPAIGLSLAFASHFLLDAIPHWDYPIQSASVNPSIAAKMRYDRALLSDLIVIGADAAIGLALGAVLFAGRAGLLLAVGGACAGILPDVLQFVYVRYPRGPVLLLQRFHWWVHASKKINRPILGVALQVALIVVVVIAVRAAVALI